MSVVGIRALLVDENAAAPTGGLADGLDRRSFEVLDMFNLGSTIWKEAHQNVEVSYWIFQKTIADEYHSQVLLEPSVGASRVQIPSEQGFPVRSTPRQR
ncbi:hypothetical protein NW762_011997 [Fusarium torreyae]|uniref:Uncharacterized protein n=1 Tax=Fusarium torreyae TaxID=1237075 RepID=A0A9W8VBS2_9HYPO|nr:hypothetical protein NW762_011997 [Fusarium torreyae]